MESDYYNLPIGTIIDVVYGLNTGAFYTTITNCCSINLSEMGYHVMDNNGDKFTISVSDLALEPFYNIREEE